MTGLPHERKRILVVDDEAAARDMAGEYLSLQGYAVTPCEDGEAMRRALAAEPADLVLLDLNMPDEDGLSVIRFLKQTTAVPVILLTATASPIDRVVGLEMGADDYLTKPCELRELLARVRAVLRRVGRGAFGRGERRLAAVASFDQVGFSRAVQSDEAATLAAIERVFAEIIAPSLPRQRGVLFKKLGDGALVEFTSVVDAVEWAVGFQLAMHDLPRMVRAGAAPEFRLGIAVGDIVVSGADRLGEAIALAVRVQERARPGSVTLSDYTRGLVGSRVSVPFADLGPVALKNIAEPMRLWEWTPGRQRAALDQP
jgi:CheY-like chemotaxis protein